MTREDKVTSMAQTAGLVDPDRARLEAHWRDIGGARDIPARADLDPATVAPCLDRMLLIERIAPRQSRIRLAGQGVTALQGHALRGMPLACLMAPPARDWLGDVTMALYDTPARIELGLAGPRSRFRLRSRASLLLLPLRDQDGTVSLGLGFLTLPKTAFATGTRFEICGEARRTLQCQETQTSAEEPIVPDAFDTADRARDVLRRRQSFRVIG